LKEVINKKKESFRVEIRRRDIDDKLNNKRLKNHAVFISQTHQQAMPYEA
jgi:hypothetical protein